MKAIAIVSLEEVGIIDDTARPKLSIELKVFTDKGDNFTYGRIIAPFPNLPSDLNNFLKTELASKLYSNFGYIISQNDIFLGGELVIDSNDQIQSVNSSLVKVQDDLNLLKSPVTLP